MSCGHNLMAPVEPEVLYNEEVICLAHGIPGLIRWHPVNSPESANCTEPGISPKHLQVWLKIQTKKTKTKHAIVHIINHL